MDLTRFSSVHSRQIFFGHDERGKIQIGILLYGLRLCVTDQQLLEWGDCLDEAASLSKP